MAAAQARGIGLRAAAAALRLEGGRRTLPCLPAGCAETPGWRKTMSSSALRMHRSDTEQGMEDINLQTAVKQGNRRHKTSAPTDADRGIKVPRLCHMDLDLSE